MTFDGGWIPALVAGVLLIMVFRQLRAARALRGGFQSVPCPAAAPDAASAAQRPAVSQADAAAPGLIKLHRLGGQEIALNPAFIASVQPVPNTLVVLSDNNRFLVRESVDDVMARITSVREESSRIVPAEKELV